MRTIAVLLVLAVILAVPQTTAAQLKGHYVPGFTGVGNGSQGHPAITVIFPGFIYSTDTINDASGDALGVHPQITASFFAPGLVWVTNVKVLGGHLGGQVLPVAYMKSQIEGPSLDVPGSFRFTDIYAQPVQLGWSRTHADFVAGYGVFMPTGEWEFLGDGNGGLGMWSHLFQGGTTVRFDDKREWSVSALGGYEIHSDKRNTDLKVGHIMTIEGGFARSFYKQVSDTSLPRILTIGVPYYTQFKVTADSATVFSDFLAENKDRVFAVGAEGSIFLPKPKLLLGLRVLSEMGAASRTQGLTYVMTIAYQSKSLVKATP
jgi:hypothetical protein